MSFDNKTVVQLKELLKAKQLPISGTKAQLIQRLEREKIKRKINKLVDDIYTFARTDMEIIHKHEYKSFLSCIYRKIFESKCYEYRKILDIIDTFYHIHNNPTKKDYRDYLFHVAMFISETQSDFYHR